VVDLGHAPGSVVAKPLTKEIYPRIEKDSGDSIVRTVVAPETDGPLLGRRQLERGAALAV